MLDAQQDSRFSTMDATARVEHLTSCLATRQQRMLEFQETHDAKMAELRNQMQTTMDKHAEALCQKQKDIDRFQGLLDKAKSIQSQRVAPAQVYEQFVSFGG